MSGLGAASQAFDASAQTLDVPLRHGRARRERAHRRSRARWRTLPRAELAGLIGLAAVLNLWALWRNHWANNYYTPPIRSMASSWHNFLYGSFDPSGVMSVDKPPLALWVQAWPCRSSASTRCRSWSRRR